MKTVAEPTKPVGDLCPEHELVARLGEALDSRGQPHGRLFLIAPPRLQPRSTIYFVGDSSRASHGCQWVVKRPNRRAAQADLANPIDAERQFEALRLLATHFEPVGPALRVSRPIAFLPEIGALVVEYASG